MRRLAPLACAVLLATLLATPASAAADPETSVNPESSSASKASVRSKASVARGAASPIGLATTRRCVAWKRHQRRVVTRVRRGGEVKRVVRVKRWRTCKRRAAPAPSAPGLDAPTVPGPGDPAAPGEPQPEAVDPAVPRIGVKAVEWSYTLSRPQVPAGAVVVELNNMGEDPHNLNLQLEDGGATSTIPTIGPAQQKVAQLTLAAGAYRLWCDLDEHAERGMRATLQVTG